MKKTEIENKTIKKPWPTKAVMEQIYEKKLWGGQQSDFYSGAGSHRAEIVNPYIEVVSAFLASFESPITVCDLGCGDFNVGKELVKHTKKLVAVDIVPDLIDRNKDKFQEENLEFRCLDLAKDILPSADCALLRQVLQHLSNKEAQQVVAKLHEYKYVISTEHIPKGEFTPNKDIISGQGIRLKKQSGINLLAEPFNFRPKTKKQLTSVLIDNAEGIIVTTLYVMF